MSYIVYHPDTGTIMAADDSCLVDIDDLPPDFDDWEEYLALPKTLMPMGVRMPVESMSMRALIG